MEELGPNTPKGPGIYRKHATSSTPHVAPNELFRLISIQAFQVIDLIFAISFSIWAWAFMKKLRNLFMNQNLFIKKS